MTGRWITPHGRILVGVGGRRPPCAARIEASVGISCPVRQSSWGTGQICCSAFILTSSFEGIFAKSVTVLQGRLYALRMRAITGGRISSKATTNAK